MEDLFWGWGFWGQQSSRQQTKKEEPVNLDFEKTYEVPIFDLILGCKIEVKWVYWNTAKLKIPPSTKPWTKFRVKWFWKKEPGREGNLIVKVEALMPKNISEVDMSMLERIRENIGY
jgi:DnaJ-class molecular chaperone